MIIIVKFISFLESEQKDAVELAVHDSDSYVGKKTL